MARQQKLDKVNVPVLLRHIAKAQEELIKFALRDYPQGGGYRTDFTTCVCLLELRDTIDRFVGDKKDDSVT